MSIILITVFVIILLLLYVVDYDVQGKAVYKKTIKELYMVQERGERLLNVLGSAYLSAVYFLLDTIEKNMTFKCAIMGLTLVAIGHLNYRLYRYKERIMILEDREKRIHENE